MFQVESAGMRKALVEIESDRFTDIVAIVALYRPGPMANIAVYCARKLGKDEHNRNSWYLHPKLEPILKETFGIIVYQEQVMEVAKVLAGYSLGDADLLRHAMGKKIKAEMDAQRDRFVKGCLANGIERAKANEISTSSEGRRLRIQQEPCGRLCARRLSDRLSEGQPPGGVPRGLHDDGSRQHRQALRVPREAQRLGIPVEPPSINRSGVVFDVAYDREGRDPSATRSPP